MSLDLYKRILSWVLWDTLVSTGNPIELSDNHLENGLLKFTLKWTTKLVKVHNQFSIMEHSYEAVIFNLKSTKKYLCRIMQDMIIDLTMQ